MGMNRMEKTYQNILTALKYYIPIKYWNLNNWDVIIKREEEVEKNIFKYECSFYTLYFNDELKPIEYGKQHIIDNKVYYDTSDNGISLAYLFLGHENWFEQNNWGI